MSDDGLSDDEKAADGMGAVWSHVAHDLEAASVHSETEKHDAFPGSPYTSASLQSPNQPETPGIALSRASSIPAAGTGLPAFSMASSMPAVDGSGAFMLGGSGVGFSALSTVGFSTGALPAGGTGTAVLQGSSFSALPGSYTSPWRSRPMASVAGDGFEELSMDLWSGDPLKDSLWQCGQV